MKDGERCGRNKEVNRPELIGQRVKVRVTLLRFFRIYVPFVYRERFRIIPCF